MRRRPAVHRILDDSVGRSARITSRFSSDLVINRCHGGGTQSSVMRMLPEDIKPWDHATSTFNMTKGSVVVWLSGNDVRNKRTGLGTIQDDMSRLRDDIIATLKFLAAKGPASIVVLGPHPRLHGESSGLAWERTASYHMERATNKAVEATAMMRWPITSDEDRWRHHERYICFLLLPSNGVVAKSMRSVCNKAYVSTGSSLQT